MFYRAKFSLENEINKNIEDVLKKYSDHSNWKKLGSTLYDPQYSDATRVGILEEIFKVSPYNRRIAKSINRIVEIDWLSADPHLFRKRKKEIKEKLKASEIYMQPVMYYRTPGIPVNSGIRVFTRNVWNGIKEKGIWGINNYIDDNEESKVLTKYVYNFTHFLADIGIKDAIKRNKKWRDMLAENPEERFERYKECQVDLGEGTKLRVKIIYDNAGVVVRRAKDIAGTFAAYESATTSENPVIPIIEIYEMGFLIGQEPGLLFLEEDKNKKLLHLSFENQKWANEIVLYTKDGEA